MNMSTRIEEVPVARDDTGYWLHPHHPEFTAAPNYDFHEWVQRQQLKLHYTALESDSDHAAHDRYFGDGNVDVRDWSPPQPVGPGWFTLAIYDTGDGPVWAWARRLPLEHGAEG